MLNKQIPIKQDLSSPDLLSVNSIFYTIQGEGPFAGTPAVFVRLAGCNLQCPACDTEYGETAKMTVDQIIGNIGEAFGESTRAETYPNYRPLVVITGGEPFRQNLLHLLTDLIEDYGFRVQIETNGTLFVDMEWVYTYVNHFTIVCSPKAGKVNKDLWRHIKALKYVLHADEIDPADGLPIRALQHGAVPKVARPPEGWKGEIYVQPIDVQDEAENARHLKAAVESAMKFGYRLCLQTHKIIGVA